MNLKAAHGQTPEQQISSLVVTESLPMARWPERPWNECPAIPAKKFTPVRRALSGNSQTDQGPIPFLDQSRIGHPAAGHAVTAKAKQKPVESMGKRNGALAGTARL